MLSHVYEEYLDPQFDLMEYTDRNRTNDRTFYHRCKYVHFKGLRVLASFVR